MISIKGLDKAKVLAALYNASRPLGMGYLHFDPNAMTHEEAEKHISEGGTWVGRGDLCFDYLKGRVLKVDLAEDEFDPWLYDRDNGNGAAEKVIAVLLEEA